MIVSQIQLKKMTTFGRKDGGSLGFVENPLARISITYMVGVSGIQSFFSLEAICFGTASLILSSEKNVTIKFISNTRRLSFGFERCLSHLRIRVLCLGKTSFGVERCLSHLGYTEGWIPASLWVI